MKVNAKAWERMQKAIFDGVQEDVRLSKQDDSFVPYGRCPRHPHVTTSNGMFDAPCDICEAENDGY